MLELGKTIRVRLTFVRPILGGTPGNKDVYRDYIGSKAPDPVTLKEELEYLPEDEVVDKGKTIFPKLPGTDIPVLKDYMIKGFFKSACGFLRKTPDAKSKSLKAHKRVIDGNIFVFGDEAGGTAIPIQGVKPKDMDELQRPLRAETAQGPRVSLAISEMLPEGAFVEFNIQMLNPADEAYVREWLDYGKLSGIGQWRNASYGRFTWKEIPLPDPKAKKYEPAVKFV